MVKTKAIYGVILSLALLLMGSCVKEPGVQNGNEASLSLVFPTSRGPGDDPEFVMETLRVIIFESNTLGAETGSPVLNKLYLPDAGLLAIHEIVPVGYLNIYIIANETANLGDLSLISSSPTLRTKLLDYHAGKNVLPLPMGLPTIPAILMYSEYRAAKIDESGVFTHPKAKVGSGGETILEVERTIAKITVSIDCEFANIPGNTEIALTGARIVNMPYSPWLVANSLPYGGSAVGDYFNSPALSMTSYIVPKLDPSPPNAAIGIKTIPTGFTFYMPEHVPGVPSASNRGYYTYLELTGNTVGAVPALSLIYKIPLGNGLGTSIYTIDYLLENYATIPASVLTVSRNTHYILNLNIKGLGMREALEVIVTAKPWKPTIHIVKDFE